MWKKSWHELTRVQNLSGGFPHVIPGGSTLILMKSFMDAGFGWHAYCSHTEPSSVLTKDLHSSYWPSVEAKQCSSSSRNTVWRSMAVWRGVWSGVRCRPQSSVKRWNAYDHRSGNPCNHAAVLLYGVLTQLVSRMSGEQQYRQLSLSVSSQILTDPWESREGRFLVLTADFLRMMGGGWRGG